MKQNILQLYLFLFLHGSLAALEVSLATLNVLGEAAYQDKVKGAGMLPAVRRGLFSNIARDRFRHMDVVALQEAQCQARDAHGSIVRDSLFEDEAHFEQLLNLPLHRIVRSKLNTEFVMLFREDKYDLVREQDLLVSPPGETPRYAQIVTLAPNRVANAYLVIANMHLRGGEQSSVAGVTAAQLALLRGELLTLIKGAHVAGKDVFVAALGDFNIAASCYEQGTHQTNYDKVIVPFMEGVTVVASDGFNFDGLYDAFDGMPTARAGRNKALDCLDYIFFGSNCGVQGRKHMAIPAAADVQEELLTHTSADEDRNFPSDHSLLLAKLRVDFPGLVKEGKEGKKKTK